MTNDELTEQNTAIRASMADTSILLDRAYGSSGERLELRIARLIKVETQLRVELARVQAEYADYQRVAQASTVESVMSGARLRGALASAQAENEQVKTEWGEMYLRLQKAEHESNLAIAQSEDARQVADAVAALIQGSGTIAAVRAAGDSYIRICNIARAALEGGK